MSKKKRKSMFTKSINRMTQSRPLVIATYCLYLALIGILISIGIEVF